MNSRFTAALRIKPFLFLWLAEICSQIAMNMLNFILILVAYQLTNSNTAVSGIVLTFTVPAVIFALIAGALVDRQDKKKVLFVTNFARACLLVSLALFHRNLPLLYTLAFSISIANQFFIPAETPMIPLVVKKDMLYSANALFGIALYGSILLAYGLSGPMLLLFKPTLTFLTLAALFLVASLFIYLVKEPKLATIKQRAVGDISLMKEIRKAIKLIFKTKQLYGAFVLLIVAQVLILIVSVLGPGYAKHILGISIAEFPLLFVTPAAIGTVLGAIVITHFFHDYPKQRSARIGLFISAASVLLLPYGSKVSSRVFVHTLNEYLPKILRINILHIMVVLAFIMGFALSLVFVPSNTIIQEHTSDDVRGKVYGTLNSAASLVSLLPIILVGSLADIFGITSVLVVVGVCIAVIGIMHIIFE